MIAFGTQKAPAPSVVLPYYATGAVVFLLITLLLFFCAGDLTGHYFQPHLLTLTHLTALGWATMLIFGASHQLLPVVMEVHLFSERLARYCLYLLIPGIALLVVAFWLFRPDWMMQLGALLLLAAFVLYAINVQGTARRKAGSDVVAECIVTASWWLVLTAALGTVLVFNLRYAFLPRSHLYYLKVHAHLGLAGWFLLLVMGVAARLIPMFLLSPVRPGKAVTVAYWCINGALLVFIGMAFFLKTEAYWWISACIALFGLLAYGTFLWKVYRKAVRKKNMDVPMKMSLTALGCLLLPFVWLGFLFFTQATQQALTFAVVYGISLLGGFVTLLILGQTFKTLPFIVWMHRYRDLLGKTKTPLPRDLYRQKAIRVLFYSYLGGWLLLMTGVLCGTVAIIQLGAFALVFAAIWYNLSVWRLLLHKVAASTQSKAHGKSGAHGSSRVSES